MVGLMQLHGRLPLVQHYNKNTVWWSFDTILMLFPAQQTPFFACGSVQSNYNKLTRWRTPSKGPDLPAKGQLPRVRPVSSYRRRVSVNVWFYSCKNTHTKDWRWKVMNFKSTDANTHTAPHTHLLPSSPCPALCPPFQAFKKHFKGKSAL